MTIQNLITVLDQWAPPAYAEDFDNVGLLVGDPKKKCLGALITLDCTEDVMEEAINKKCNLIISFHFWFRDLLRELNKKYEVLLIILFLVFLLFLVSEGLLFVSFFWTSFHSLSSPSLGI